MSNAQFSAAPIGDTPLNIRFTRTSQSGCGVVNYFTHWRTRSCYASVWRWRREAMGGAAERHECSRAPERR